MCIDKDSENFEGFTEEYFLFLIENKVPFDSEDCCEMIDRFEIATIYGEPRRWTRTVRSICKLNHKYYCINWEQGLTEHQEDLYDDSSVTEVIHIDAERTIIERSWIDAKTHDIITKEIIKGC